MCGHVYFWDFYQQRSKDTQTSTYTLSQRKSLLIKISISSPPPRLSGNNRTFVCNSTLRVFDLLLYFLIHATSCKYTFMVLCVCVCGKVLCICFCVSLVFEISTISNQQITTKVQCIIEFNTIKANYHQVVDDGRVCGGITGERRRISYTHVYICRVLQRITIAAFTCFRCRWWLYANVRF